MSCIESLMCLLIEDWLLIWIEFVWKGVKKERVGNLHRERGEANSWILAMIKFENNGYK